MKWRDLLDRADRVQKSRSFKIAASVVVVVSAILVVSIYALQRGLEATEGTLGASRAAATEGVREGPDEGAEGGSSESGDANVAALTTDEGVVIPPEQAGDPRVDANAVGTTGRAVQRMLSGREDLTSLGVGVAIVAGLSLVVVWLGFFLTHLAIAALIALVAVPMTQVRATQSWGWVLLGLFALSWAFNVGLALLRVVLSPPSPVLAVARNVLAEAVRLKLSLLFIVMLMFLLATLPMLLDPETPLRYRVQAFLQYSTSGSFWLIAILTLLFSVSSVTLEQRSKIIWQTMTKPVAPWQYLLGKWLGVVSLNAVLLLVCASGVFLFTEYLRSTKALGETSAYVPVNPSERITEDRMILETQVLRARVTLQPPPDITKDSPAFRDAVRETIEGIKQTDPAFTAAENDAQRNAALDAMYARMEDDLYTQWSAQMRSIEPNAARPFTITGLDYAEATDQPLMLRFKFEAGSNRPDEIYRVTIGVGNPHDGLRYYLSRQSGLNLTQSVPLSPMVLVRPPGFEGLGFGISVDDPRFADAERLALDGEPGFTYFETGDLVHDGELEIMFFNGDRATGETNPDPMIFPEGGVEVSYSHGGFRANFLRVVLVLWIKLAFLAMLAVAASTFLSFPVACLVAFGTFLAAESSGFLATALETYMLTDRQNNPLILNHIFYGISSAVAAMFEVYRSLDPIGRIVEGRLLSWSSTLTGTLILGAITAVLYGVGVLIFRRRELATYSGQ